ncbi:MAG TPA: alpha/beta hydrolase [Alphaproteobacteria bacterium]|nr:alpha/beta hydrolase [Alphaproteobacteria bacterium]HAJ47285.1 alpha/beta hydrolase [Alphaproteobacteria bacterium]
MDAKALKPPPLRYLLTEGRAVAELGAMVAAAPFLRLCPKGDGHPVMCLPGLGGPEASTRPLRGFLRRRGYEATGWGQGTNLGLRPGVWDRMLDRLDTIYARSRRKVSLVGWSLGGIFAREIAKQRPHMVRQVITLGSPFAGHPRSTHAWRVYELTSGHRAEHPPMVTNLAVAPPVPTTSIYSRSDGVVAWQGCLNKPHAQAENVEVEGAHCGLGHNPLALAVIADRLAQADGFWSPWERTGWRRMAYPNPNRA